MTNFTTTPATLDPDASKWMQFWMEQNMRKDKSFVVIIFLSSAPFLCVIILILAVFAILSCVFKIRTKDKRRRIAKNVEMLENFLSLYSKTKQERVQREEYFQEKWKNKRLSEHSMNTSQMQKDFQLPDENKVPYSLFKEALENPNAQVDQEVVKIIDNLINPPVARKNQKSNSPILELISRLHNLDDYKIEGKKNTSSSEKSVQFENNGYEDNENSKWTEHGIRIVVEDYDGQNFNLFSLVYELKKRLSNASDQFMKLLSVSKTIAGFSLLQSLDAKLVNSDIGPPSKKLIQKKNIQKFYS
ncbi:hypothetical protein BpHYR1_019908 [Brachionus plicatilis]|uniref:Uncharacterized protein n=1 Tax=Brachionus plicatilis TaxID=10195 RepID=A0A3M7PSH3_BRAPC|nr:hypothetical protein BpHYR1_019908 [Brachionus plicatilis]